MSTPTSNTAVTSTTSSRTSIGLIIGGIVLAMIIIGVVIYVLKKRRNGSNLGAAAVPTAANGLGVMNQGTNAVPRTNMNMNSGNGRPPQ
jgi:flagellar biogenesis protein FliO